MRLTGIRLPLLAALACASVGLFVWATDRTYGDTIYVSRRLHVLVSSHTSYPLRMCCRRVMCSQLH